MVILMTVMGVAAGLSVVGAVVLAALSSLRNEKRKIQAMAKEMRAEVPARYLRG